MATINDIDEVTVRKCANGMWECSTIYNGRWIHKYYMGYTKAQAIKKFKDAVKKGEI